MQPIIHLENVSKRFRLTAERPDSLLETFVGWVSRRGRKRPRANHELWAVRGLTLDIMPGQSVGFIGRNGGGKSTALKLIAGILRPTEGAVQINGRISALLELGAGFHPDLTGRENIYLNGAILGLTKEMIEEKFDQIVAFSELKEFIDMPVKHYSSGMYMRLGFSVAIHVEPDILIIDEILAVGDQAFQNKCLDRIFKLKRGGTTIIMVSHDLGVIRNLCSHLVWMDEGKMRASGPTNEVAAEYLAYSQGIENEALLYAPHETLQNFRRWGTGELTITAVRFLDADGREQKVFNTGRPMTIEIHYQAENKVHHPEFGLAIFRQDGIHISGPNNRLGGMDIEAVEGRGVIRYRIERLPLLTGTYTVSAAVHDALTNRRAFDFHEQAYQFRVAADAAHAAEGLLQIEAAWEWEHSLHPSLVEK